jgi:hypothetical protein
MQADGTPAQRDPVFLQETGLMPSAARILARQAAAAPAQGTPLAKSPSLGYVRPPSAAAMADSGSGLTSSSVDPAVPITMYTEAAAKMTYNSTFYLSCPATLAQLHSAACRSRDAGVAGCLHVVARKQAW